MAHFWLPTLAPILSENILVIWQHIPNSAFPLPQHTQFQIAF